MLIGAGSHRRLRRGAIRHPLGRPLGPFPGGLPFGDGFAMAPHLPAGGPVGLGVPLLPAATLFTPGPAAPLHDDAQGQTV